ncbi:MAG: hypothetical protein GXP28_09240 [Planctomycetes bacterium]|nr:hypothetical protein [Planctomycetota bacterium]
MISKTTRNFREALATLPTNIRKKAALAYQRFRDNPKHPSLHYKKVHSTKPIYSVRISNKHRTVGIVENETIVWFWIGIHADYEELLKRI